MRSPFYILVLVSLLCILPHTHADSNWLTQFAAAVHDATAPVYSSIYDRCAIDTDAIATIKHALSSTIVGQPFAIDTVTHLLSHHLTNIDSPARHSKALVLSFHGLTGTGKTLMRKIIGDHLFVGGADTKHVLHFHGNDYSDHRQEQALKDKQRLRRTIKDALSTCPYTMIVFEEMHQMSPIILNELSHLFKEHSTLDGVDVSKAIYVLTSNTGGGAIQKFAFDAEKQGIVRANIDYALIAAAIVDALRKQSLLLSLIDMGVVDAFIPFFPLFKSHVKQCFDRQLNDRQALMMSEGMIGNLSWDDSVLNYGASLLTYVGPVSQQGCRPVSLKVTVDMLGQIEREQSLGELTWWGKRRWGLGDKHVTLTVVEHSSQGELARKKSVHAVITLMSSGAPSSAPRLPPIEKKDTLSLAVTVTT